MKIVFVSNFFNHHQYPVSEAFYKLTEGNYWFVETTPITAWRKKMGYTEIKVPYTIKLTPENKNRVINLIDIADVVITDAEYLELTANRYNEGKLIFRYSERLFKSWGRYLKAPIHAIKAWKTRNMYLLCCGAFVAKDYHRIGFYQNRSYKWGYFPIRDNKHILDLTTKHRTCDILWVGRLIDWKHPESIIFLAEKLVESGCEFNINVIGWGNLEDWLRQKIQNKQLSNYVHFLGSMSPSQVREHMENSKVLIFTSDEGEGWGAVLNEAMDSGCAVVASDKIGAVPFLISRDNGLIFRNKDWSDLYSKVKKVLDDDELRMSISTNAIKTIATTWNADNAARNFIVLTNSILCGLEYSVDFGPCSPVE